MLNQFHLAGDGEVAANILFLVDSSASMNTWIGNDGLGPAPRAVYDSEDRILINQNGRRARGVVRYTAAGAFDTTFTPIRRTPAAGCTNIYNAGANTTMSRNIRRNADYILLRTLPLETLAIKICFSS